MKKQSLQLTSRMFLLVWVLCTSDIFAEDGAEDGDIPDLSGNYNVATLTPLQRPEIFGDNLYLSKWVANLLAFGVEFGRKFINQDIAKQIEVLQDTIKSIDLEAKFEEFSNILEKQGFSFDQGRVDQFIDDFLEDQEEEEEEEEEAEEDE